MTSITHYNLSNGETSTAEVADNIFAIEPNTELIHQAITAQRRNKQLGLAHTQIREDVRGGGKKPWKQKGTGRARTSSIRSPLFAGGAVIFGPRKHNVSEKFPKKMKKRAIASALSIKIAEKRLASFEGGEELIKTKQLAEFAKNTLPGHSKLLIVCGEKSSATIKKSSKNIEGITCVTKSIPNVYDLINNDLVLIDKEIIDQITEKFADITITKAVKVDTKVAKKVAPKKATEKKATTKKAAPQKITEKKATTKKIATSKSKEGDK